MFLLPAFKENIADLHQKDDTWGNVQK